MALSSVVDTEISSGYAHYTNDVSAIRHLHEANEDPREVVREMVETTDTLILRIYLYHLQRILDRDEPPSHILLLAQGGYGRRELHPKSDVDIMFLHVNPLSKKESELVKGIFRNLFDLGFQVGHCCRSYKEALDIAVRDTHSQTAMCESRFLSGDWRLFERFKNDLWRRLWKNRYEYIRRKVRESEERASRFGLTINISEPNVKESKGGLRDYHLGIWTASLWEGRTMKLLHLKRSHLIDDQMMTMVEEAIAFLWRLRNDLHFLTGKEQDVLALPLQHEVSKRLGYRDRRGRLAEEEMMREYYKHAVNIRRFSSYVIQRCAPKSVWSFLSFKRSKKLADGFYVRNNQIHVPRDIHFFEHNPKRLLQVFIHAAEQEATLAEDTVSEIHDNLELIDHTFLFDKHNAALLRRFFALPDRIEGILREMRRIGILKAIIPEWRGIANLVRYDLVHRYTVDEHSLLTLYHIENLHEDTFNFARERYLLWNECKEKDTLRLAALFHDIGKGKPGNHSHTGADLVDRITRRMRLPEAKRKRLDFLIRNHLLMSRTAQRRDLSDPEVLADFADAFDSGADLDMMYLLTYADMRSVSPESMTEWKNNLLWDLYLATRRVFENEAHADADETIHVVSQKESLMKALGDEFEHTLVREHLECLPASYLLHQSVDQVRQHLACLNAFDGSMPVTRFYPHLDPDCREMVLVYLDKVGLFNRICAAMTLENFSIIEARLNTRSDGVIVNNLVIRDTLRNGPISESRQHLLQERLTRILPSDEETPPIPKMTKISNVGRSSCANQIKVINDITARFTVVEVRSADSGNLLQQLTGVISAMKLNIHFARIISEGVRLTVIFYVADSSGGKILEEEQVERLHKELQNVIESDSKNV